MIGLREINVEKTMKEECKETHEILVTWDFKT